MLIKNAQKFVSFTIEKFLSIFLFIDATMELVQDYLKSQ